MGKKNGSLSLKEAVAGMDPQQAILAIENAIDKSLGNGTSDLVFKTLKLIYNFEKDAIPSNIERFEELMNKIFGKGAKPVIKKIVLDLERFKNENH